jgi:hypothetical protein
MVSAMTWMCWHSVNPFPLGGLGEGRRVPATCIHPFDPHPPRIRFAHDASASPKGRGTRVQPFSELSTPRGFQLLLNFLFVLWLLQTLFFGFCRLCLNRLNWLMPAVRSNHT